MKSLTPFRLLGMVVLILGLTCIALNAQQDPQEPSSQTPAQSQPQDQQPATPDQTGQSPDAQQSQTFMGTIVKSQGSLVLKDSATNTMYKLDAVDQAKHYVGKSVRVTGTLDPATNTIHVTNIEMPSKG